MVVFGGFFGATLYGRPQWVALALAPVIVAWVAAGVVQFARKGRPVGMGPVVAGVILLALATAAVVYALFHVREMIGLPLVYLAIAVLSLVAMGSLLRKADARTKARTSAGVEDVHSVRPEVRLTALAIFALIVCVAALMAIAAPIISLIVLGTVAAWMLMWLPRRMRTRHSDFQILIRCTTQQAFDFVSDQRNVPRYVSQTEVAELLTPPTIGIGSMFRQRTRTPDFTDPLLGTIPGAVVEADGRITAFDPPRRVVFEIVGGNGSEVVYTFEPAESATEVRVANYVVFDLVTAWLGIPLQPVARRAEELLSGMRADWYGRLKEILEAQAVVG